MFTTIKTLWHRVIATIITADPNPEYSALDHWAGLK